NAIVPNMLWAGLAFYPSDIIPVAIEVQEKGDQIDQCLSACKKYGVQIHIWKVNWNLSTAPEEFVEKMRKEGKLQCDKNGNEIRWLCPSHEDNYQIELESMLEIVKKYKVDGIHFDYIRYPHGDSCYCNICKEKFEEWIGEKVEHWPQEVIDGKYKEKYIQYRCDQITRLVKAVNEKAKEINPDIKISAAVFSDYPRCRESVGQDWELWVKSGYLDFVCPMNYTADNNHFSNIVSNQIKIVKNQIPLYPGIGASAPGLTPDQVAIQAFIARNLGANGFIIFNYDLTVANDVLPALLKGISSE
ncbi:MAG: glycoside hydrolase family 10 protein, partial [bacterium]